MTTHPNDFDPDATPPTVRDLMPKGEWVTTEWVAKQRGRTMEDTYLHLSVLVVLGTDAVETIDPGHDPNVRLTRAQMAGQLWRKL